MTTQPHPAAGGAETVPHSTHEPIFEDLARRWGQAGRVVPGEVDREWAALTGRSPWPGGDRCPGLL